MTFVYNCGLDDCEKIINQRSIFLCTLCTRVVYTGNKNKFIYI